ncbi:hypothetical protein B0H11DRAFT_1991507 [Mycena galericulata]|nr:hypothetical protein B0H11DRAFT_1991507 [Mycena galericulata]
MLLSPSISTRYRLGLAISAFQVVSAACLLPLFPVPRYDPSLCEKAGTFETLCLLIFGAVFSCFGWLMVIEPTSPKNSGARPAAGAMTHIVILLTIATFWILEAAVLVMDARIPSSPFWTFVSSCTMTGFTTSAKCTGVRINLLLSLVNLILFLGTAWTIYRHAYAQYGAEKVLSSHNGPEHAIAWTLGDVWELDGTGNEEGSSSLHKGFSVKRRFPLMSSPSISYLYRLCFTVSVVQFLLASYLSPFFRTTRQPYPCEDDALAKENILPSPDIRAALAFAVLIGFFLVLLMGSCLRSAPPCLERRWVACRTAELGIVVYVPFYFDRCN